MFNLIRAKKEAVKDYININKLSADELDIKFPNNIPLQDHHLPLPDGLATIWDPYW